MNWSLALDKLSVHVGINFRLRAMRLRGEVPVRILLGREHTRLFMREEGWLHLPSEQFRYGPKGRELPVIFNYPNIYGVAIEAASGSTT